MFPVRSAAISKIRNRADLAESMFIDDDELIDLANDQVEIAYHHCVSAYGDTTFATELVISGIGGGSGQATIWPEGPAIVGGIQQGVQTRFNLPMDFGRLLRCEFCEGTVGSAMINGLTYHLMAQPNVRWFPMLPFDIAGSAYDSTPKDWLQEQVAYWIQAHPGPNLPFELNQNDSYSQFWISFMPVPKAIVSVHLIDVPIAPAWGADDSYLIRLPDLAWKYVREATAADLLDKQRSDSSTLRQNAMQYLADIENAKLHPDFGNAPGTVDIYGGSGVPPYGRRRTVW